MHRLSSSLLPREIGGDGVCMTCGTQFTVRDDDGNYYKHLADALAIESVDDVTLGGGRYPVGGCDAHQRHLLLPERPHRQWRGAQSWCPAARGWFSERKTKLRKPETPVRFG